MGSVATTRPHVVLVPYPAQGHVTPLMQLAKLLHSKGIYITFVNTEHNHKRLIRSKGQEFVNGLSDFRFESIPDGLPPSDFDSTQDVPSLSYATQNNCLGPFKKLIEDLNSSSVFPPVSCIISDGIMSFAIKAAKEFGIPEIPFWTASACSFMCYLHHAELVKRGIVPFKDENFLWDGTLNTPIDFIPGIPNMQLKDMPSFIRVTDINDIMFNFLGSEAQNCLKSSAIIFNTFNEFEPQIFEEIAAKFPNIYTIGPLTLLEKNIVPETKSNSLRSNLWKEDLECLNWLDMKEPNSVVYINYGSITTITDQHLEEFAWGLANSKHQFLWVVRPNMVMGKSKMLPEKFYEEIKGRGLLVSWCPQDRVLEHSSIGAFLTHCGWNSVMESVSSGVPIICWPFFADQQTNCKYACNDWGIGMELSHDFKRDEVVIIVKELMESDRGKKLREKAMDWKKKAEETTNVGGLSYNNFERFIKEALNSFTENGK